MIKPKVSIIIPVYNSGAYLERCLASVCGQVFKEIEIICINDGSTDNSPEILQELASCDERIVIIEQKNMGVASARNRGLEKASAPYIGFVDSDDFIAPDMFEKMYNAMVQNDVDFVECCAEPVFCCNYINKDEARKYLTTRGLSGKVEERTLFIKTTEALWKMLFKAELLTKYNLTFPEGFCSYEDGLFIISYKSIANSGFYINESLYIYYYYDDSIIGKSRKKKQGKRVLELLEIIKLYYFFLIKHNIFESFKDIFWDFFVDNINSFYNYAEPEVIQFHGIKLIRELVNINEISMMVKEKNKAYLMFNKSNDRKLINFSSLNKYQQSRVFLKKIVKNTLPYGIVMRMKREEGVRV